MSRETDFQSKLVEIFRSEAREHRQAILSGLLEIEKGKAGAEREAQVVESVFREAHSLKGAARAVNMTQIETLCQSLESIFSMVKNGRGRLREGMYDTLYKAMDRIEQLEGGLGGEASDPDLAHQLNAICANLERGDTKGQISPPPSPGTVAGEDRHDRKAPPAASETIRISSTRLGSLYLKAEELLSVKEALRRRAETLRGLAVTQQSCRSKWNDILPHASKMRRLLGDLAAPQWEDLAGASGKVLDFLEWAQTRAAEVGESLGALSKAAGEDDVHAGELIDLLLDEMQAVLMLPFSSLLELFPRMVRDLAREEAKQATWEVLGEEIEIDRRVLEGIKDPLVHLVRNCISHGIEKPDARSARGKKPEGRVALKIAQLGSAKAEIVLSDDGAGVDLASVKAAAVKRGFLAEEEAGRIDDRKALSLIFLSEVSTSPLITDLSGRGLGLAIAREKIESLGGLISVETRRGEGTEFRIQLPLTLSTFRGVIVRTGGQRFVIPTMNVERVIKVDRVMVASVENRESISIDDRAVSLLSLSHVLGLDGGADGNWESFPAVVLHASGTRGAFRVEEVLGEQEVLVKSLGRQLVHVQNVSGATVLDGGAVVPILNVVELLQAASRTRTGAANTPSEAMDSRKRKILVAEDSATSRVLLKSILESAGFEVKTAVDGAEAFASLRTETFDLLVSDVDMPRMNGFLLSEKIREHVKLANMPIVLVTSLESREDRERGVDAGANAYIVKSSFDQSNLLETIRRLL